MDVGHHGGPHFVFIAALNRAVHFIPAHIRRLRIHDVLLRPAELRPGISWSRMFGSNSVAPSCVEGWFRFDT